MRLTVTLVIFSLLFYYNVDGRLRVKRIVGGVPAEVPPSAGNVANPTRPTTTVPATTAKPLIFVRRDRRSAVVNGVKNDDNSYSFLGIRYAEPPLRRFRFQRPRKFKLKGEINATKFGAPCAQWFRGRIIGSEDCLFLNIFTPGLPMGDPNPSYPVLVWIHGGNFQTGSAAQYVPTYLVKRGIVVVTVQYRLGSLGFLSTGRKELPGNTGLFDIATAMKWVHEYIRFFGGDPNRITSGGQGSGASCATMMALNKYSRRRVNGVFAMSGSPVSPFSLDESEIRTAKEISNGTGSCDSEQGFQFVRCMQKLPLETILKAESAVQDNRMKSGKFPKGLANLIVPGPSEEGKEDERFLPHFLTESPLEAIKRGSFPSIPLLTGVTKEETGGGCRGSFLSEIQKKLLSPNFLQSELFSGALFANNGLYINKTVNSQLSSLFLNGDYLKFFTTLLSSALSDLDQVIKHTTDAFFNLPAFITSHLWSKKNNVFLYSFEHTPQKSMAGEFLSGIPLIAPSSQNDKKKGAEHGDDLMYLFDIRTLEGNKIDHTALNELDQKVKDHFCTMVAEFIRTGKPGRDEWKPFNIDKGNYMIIKEEPKSAENFHKCEMGLWTGDNGLLGSADCSVLNQAQKIVTNTLGTAGSTLLSTTNSLTDTLGVNKVADQLTGITKPLDENVGTLVGGNNLLGGLLGGGGSAGGGGENTRTGTSNTTVKPVQVRSTTTKRPAGLLGGLGGGLLG